MTTFMDDPIMTGIECRAIGLVTDRVKRIQDISYIHLVVEVSVWFCRLHLGTRDLFVMLLSDWCVLL